MPSAAVLLALFSFHMPWGQSDTRSIGAWTLEVHADRFTGKAACRLSRPRIEYRRGALVVHLSRGADTSDAVYRIDGGPPIAARDDAMELARAGFALSTDDINNPSGGLVRIPESRLSQAKTVAIEPAPNHPVAQFKVDGLGAALDAAHQAACATDTFK